jgi:hypothetical protein
MRHQVSVNLALAAALLPATAGAQALPVVASDKTDSVAVTVYRDPDRGDGEIRAR